MASLRRVRRIHEACIFLLGVQLLAGVVWIAWSASRAPSVPAAVLLASNRNGTRNLTQTRTQRGFPSPSHPDPEDKIRGGDAARWLRSVTALVCLGA